MNPVVRVGAEFASFGNGACVSRTFLVRLQRPSRSSSARSANSAQPLAAMGKHFTPQELDMMHRFHVQGGTAAQLHRKLAEARRRKGGSGPDLTSVRRGLKGVTFKRAKVETRGRKRALTNVNMRALEVARKRLIKKAESQYEVHWDDVIKAARVPEVHRSTASRSMNDAGYDIKWRTPRTSIPRSARDDAERKRICDAWRKLPSTYWTDKVDAYIDCKDWPIPRSLRGREYLDRRKVRKHLRTKGEGLSRGFTKPDKLKHRMNTGPNAKLCAGIIGGKVRIWH